VVEELSGVPERLLLVMKSTVPVRTGEHVRARLQALGLREAPSLALASRLLAEGAIVRAWDPVALAEARKLLGDVHVADSLREAVEGADAALLVTEWPQLRQLPSSAVRRAMRTPLIVDARNMLDPTTVRAAGFIYDAIGRPPAVVPALLQTEEPRRELRSA
jgi:UDP-glucose 6-dehydrogenase